MTVPVAGLFERIEQRVHAQPDHPFLVEGPTVWTAAETWQQVQHWAAAFHRAGIQPGDRIALMFGNQKELVVGFLAALRIGAVALPVNLMLPPDDIAYVIQHAGARLIVANPPVAQMLAAYPLNVWVAQEADAEPIGRFPSLASQLAETDPQALPPLPQLPPDALRVLLYTSGTTGKPKGVMLSEGNLLGNLEGVTPVFPISPADTMLLALPLFHAYGLIVALLAMSTGATTVLAPKFTPQAILEALQRNRVTVLPLVPTMFSVLLQGAQKLGKQPFESIRFCITGGASLPAALLQRLEQDLGLVVLEGYGLTETSPVVAVNRLERGNIPGSVGLPLQNVDVQLRDEAGQSIAWQAGTISAAGEVCVRGPNVMLGYYNAPEATAEVLDANGWLRTGDLGHFDEEGNLVLSGGRIKDLIIKAGENLSPLRIEQVLYQHPAVLEASVIGVPDERLGEDILACVQLKPDVPAEASEIRRFCRQHLPAHMVPEAVRIYDELPKNATGKVLKKVLRQQNPTMPTASVPA